MQTQWGRKETVIFPPHSPLYSYGAIFLSVMLAGLFLYLHFAVAMSPLQRFYLPYYVRTAVAGAVHRTDKYQMLMVADGAKRSRGVRDNDVIAGLSPQIDEKPIPLQLIACEMLTVRPSTSRCRSLSDLRKRVLAAIMPLRPPANL